MADVAALLDNNAIADGLTSIQRSVLFVIAEKPGPSFMWTEMWQRAANELVQLRMVRCLVANKIYTRLPLGIAVASILYERGHGGGRS